MRGRPSGRACRDLCAAARFPEGAYRNPEVKPQVCGVFDAGLLFYRH
jgi:hypothetical protein